MPFYLKDAEGKILFSQLYSKDAWNDLRKAQQTNPQLQFPCGTLAVCRTNMHGTQYFEHQYRPYNCDCKKEDASLFFAKALIYETAVNLGWKVLVNSDFTINADKHESILIDVVCLKDSKKLCFLVIDHKVKYDELYQIREKLHAKGYRVFILRTPAPKKSKAKDIRFDFQRYELPVFPLFIKERFKTKPEKNYTVKLYQAPNHGCQKSLELKTFIQSLLEENVWWHGYKTQPQKVKLEWMSSTCYAAGCKRSIHLVPGFYLQGEHYVQTHNVCDRSKLAQIVTDMASSKLHQDEEGHRKICYFAERRNGMDEWYFANICPYCNRLQGKKFLIIDRAKVKNGEETDMTLHSTHLNLEFNIPFEQLINIGYSGRWYLKEKS